jgi:UDP-glucose 4-epimerase
VNDRLCGGTDFTEGEEWDAILIMYRGASMASFVRGKQQCEKVECHHKPQMQGHCHGLSSASRSTKEPGAFFTGNLSSVKVLANQVNQQADSVIY